MDRPALTSWNPDRSWADPFIVTLALLIFVLVNAMARRHHASPAPPPDQISLQGRVADVVLAAPKVSGSLGGKAGTGPLGAFSRKDLQGWDQAILAVHAGEDGEVAAGAHFAQAAPGGAGEAFRQTWTWAFEGTGRPPSPEAMTKVRGALGSGYAAKVLEARCTLRSGGDPKPLEREAAAWVMPRLAGLALAGLLALVLVLGGITFLIVLGSVHPERPAPLRFTMAGRAVLIVLLGWFLTHLAVGTVMSYVVAALPFLHPVALPLMYCCHALLGTAYVCWAEGISLGALWARLVPGRSGRALATGLGFFALAFTAVLAVALALSPLLRDTEPPQRELLELLNHLRGPLPVVAMFLTIAVVAPVFEELLFRGFMLPWLGERLQPRLGRRWGWITAVVITGLTFGAMHLQPMGMPTLTTLGIVLGFAFLRTGNLLTAILVHGLWNGGIFLLLRLLA